ncbi:MAG: serine/threonine-protein kinase [Gammaproteobacteria bacterium]|nr:serine/threonine-protein kinase [Gammaproteobacteria bacterium]
MANGGSGTRNWTIALVVAVVFGAAHLGNLGILEQFETIAYDNGVRLTFRTPGATNKIAIVAIDDASIERIGRWPWPRKELADMIDRLAKAGSKVIGLQLSLTEPQTDPGLKHIRKIREYVDSELKGAPRGALRSMLIRAESDLDSDNRLARSIPTANNVFLPMFFTLGEPLGNPDKTLPEFVTGNRLSRVKTPEISNGIAYPTVKATYPMEMFGKSAKGIGHINYWHDADGGVRSEPLILEHYGEYYPSLALLMAARSLNLGSSSINATLGESIGVGKLRILTDSDMIMHTGFYREDNGKPAFASYSFADVRNGSIPGSVFRDKIIIIGSTATGVGSTYITPVSGAMSEPELTANTIGSILNQDFYTRPEWAPLTELGMFVVVLLYLMLLLPRFGTGWGAFFSFIIFIGVLLAGQYFMIWEKVWLKTVFVALFLVTGHIAMTTRRFFDTERIKQAVESDSAQSNRMLGLSYQSQGQLDMAFDKFRKLPVDDSVLDLIYSLALDYERKRQFAKAVSAYDHILRHNKKFKDAKERRQRAQHVDGTIIIGGAGGNAGTMILNGLDQKPTLGRYEVEEELGKGAMGTVYLGRDPKINRVVAIKTMALSQEFDESDLANVKERFFREAETAGRLNHPNIVTIFDAGEEHDLAYIAMEFLKGKDLSNYISPMDLLPVDWSLDIVGHVADALDYAHRQDVVHRDIKPANIMYDEESDVVKVTDFGIARITASSKTKTGVVLGTPSYMSPEQLAGKHVDGRSDLFSLGVMLYELLTAEQPFNGDSMAALMYQITNKKHKDIIRVREDLPPCVRTITDKALQKDPDKRYQTGTEMREAIEKCRAKL